MKKLTLPDVNPMSARQYNYFILPKLLISSPAFRPLSCTAKIVYSLMLNRLSMSAENQEKYTDSQGRLYIIYTIEQVMEDVQCSNVTAIGVLKQLEELGLIEKKRRGQGKPTLLYVKDFTAAASVLESEGEEEGPDRGGENGKKTEKTSGSEENKCQAVREEGERCKKESSRPEKKSCQEVKKVKRKKKDLKKNDPKKDLPTLPSLFPSSFREDGREEKALSELTMEEQEENVWDQIEGEVIAQMYGEETAREAANLVLDGLCQQGPVTLGRRRYPEAVVKRRYQSLSCEHVQYALDTLYRTPGVRNPAAYLRTLLFNAPACTDIAVGAQAAWAVG